MKSKKLAVFLGTLSIVIISLVGYLIFLGTFQGYGGPAGEALKSPYVTQPQKIAEVGIQGGASIFVDCQGGSDTNDGSFWTLAKKTLANAIQSASGLTDILLKANDTCYYPGFITINKPDLFISGGYTGNTQNPQERFEDKNSVISSNHSGTVLKIYNLTGSIVFDRVTVKDGYSQSFGGGFYIANGNPQVTIQNSIIENNTSVNNNSGKGGGISVSKGIISLNKTIIRNNSSDGTGGGVDVIGANYRIFQCQFNGNTAKNGGAIKIEGGGDEDFINGNDFINNQATSTDTYQGGGAIYMKISKASVQGNFFKGNTAYYGSAINHRFDTNSSASSKLSNNIFLENQATYATMYIGKGALGMKLNNNLFIANRSSTGPLAIMVGEGSYSILVHASSFINHTDPRPLIGKDSNPQSGYGNYGLNVYPQRPRELIFDDPNQPMYSVVYKEPKFLSTSFISDPFSYEFTPDYEAKDYGAKDYTVYDFRGCPRDVQSLYGLYPDQSAYEYQNVAQYVEMNNWLGPQKNGDQSYVQLTISVKDALGNVVLSPTKRAQSANGYYSIPTRYTGISGGPYKVIVKAPGYISKAINGNFTACNSPGVNTELTIGDADNDNAVTLRDLSQILIDFAKTGPLGSLPSDLNGNETVELADLTFVLLNFAKEGEI